MLPVFCRLLLCARVCGLACERADLGWRPLSRGPGPSLGLF
jgi:hypothetical protein